MPGRTKRFTKSLLVSTSLLVILSCVTTATAQRDLPPSRGGTTYSLGMPPVYKGRVGFEMQAYRLQTAGIMASFFNMGISRDLGSPVVGIAGLRLEGYGGCLHVTRL